MLDYDDPRDYEPSDRGTEFEEDFEHGYDIYGQPLLWDEPWVRDEDMPIVRDTDGG